MSAYTAGQRTGISNPDNSLELEAEAVATRAMSGQVGLIMLLSSGEGQIQRWPFSDDLTERQKIEAALKSTILVFSAMHLRSVIDGVLCRTVEGVG